MVEILNKLEGKTIKTANISCLQGVGESLDLVFTDGSAVTIYGEMREINEIEITLHE
jgi:hypothetical protein